MVAHELAEHTILYCLIAGGFFSSKFMCDDGAEIFCLPHKVDETLPNGTKSNMKHTSKSTQPAPMKMGNTKLIS